MKFNLFISFTVIVFSSFSQEYLLEFDKYNAITRFDWRGLESTDEDSVKNDFLNYVEQNNLMVDEKMSLKLMDKSLRHSIKALDINDDNIADIIYQGPYGGEGEVVYFYLNDGFSFKNVLDFRQGIAKVVWDGDLIDKIFVRDWGCCADPNLTNSVYKVNYSNMIPNAELIWQSIELEEFTTKPKGYFDSPKRFEIVNEQYKLRAQPRIDNTINNYHLHSTGNSIGILKEKYRGTAYASSTDSTGRIWWYVIIDKEFEVEDSYIDYQYYENQPHLVGWISSRYIKEL